MNESSYHDIESDVAKDSEHRISTTNGLLEATSTSPDDTDKKLIVD